MNEAAQLTLKDFASDQEVRWCPGCGDYAILKAVQKTLADVGAEIDNTVFISGIGCAARFPYYMTTYGFHTIHGRAAAVATGTKLANPDLDVWVISGDGDSMSIGGNHLLHLLRRDIDLIYLLFNNEIYGLTKGQASPTTRLGTRTPSTPGGSGDRPVHAASLALGSGGRFIARSTDVAQASLIEILKRAREHDGTSFVEILQNCIVYNDGVYDPITDKKTAKDNQIHVQHGQPLIFGQEANKGLRLNTQSLTLEVVEIGKDGVSEDDILVHDETNPALANMLAAMDGPDFPVAMGVIYCAGEAAETHRSDHLAVDLDTLADKLNQRLRSGHTWVVQ